MASGGVIKIKVKVENKQQVKKWLERIKRKLEGPAFMKALEAGAKVYVKGAKGRAPVDTGKLKGSIHHERAEGGDPGYEIGPGKDLIPIYAAPQEFGALGHPFMWFRNKQGQLVRVRSIKAHPYIKPTFDQDTEKAFEAFKEKLWSELDK